MLDIVISWNSWYLLYITRLFVILLRFILITFYITTTLYIYYFSTTTSYLYYYILCYPDISELIQTLYTIRFKRVSLPSEEEELVRHRALISEPNIIVFLVSKIFLFSSNWPRLGSCRNQFFFASPPLAPTNHSPYRWI